jgi:hypothetical protein
MQTRNSKALSGSSLWERSNFLSKVCKESYGEMRYVWDKPRMDGINFEFDDGETTKGKGGDLWGEHGNGMM